MISKERIEKIAGAIGNDEQRIKKLFDMPPENAAKELAAEGYDVTPAELIDFAAYVNSLAGENGEIDENRLEEVSGGCWGCVGGFIKWVGSVITTHGW